VSVFRFAPSPTGFLHLGNARTALLNACWALKHAGKCYLRIDDTDKARSEKVFEKSLITDLSWLGFSFDKIFRQSERVEFYEKYIQNLKTQGLVYPCYETPEELQEKRTQQRLKGKPYRYDRSARRLTSEQKNAFEKGGRRAHWRFLLSDNSIAWQDVVKGSLSFDLSSISDPVVLRSDGTPSFLLAGLLDDLDLGITHILRGADHITNTAIQIYMKNKIAPAKTIIWGHLPLLAEKTGQLFSKRLNSLTLQHLRKEGFLPEALRSTLFSIGLSNDVTVSSLEELAHTLDLAHYKGSHAVFELSKLISHNKMQLQLWTWPQVENFLTKSGKQNTPSLFWSLVKENVTTLKDLLMWHDLCFSTQDFSHAVKLHSANSSPFIHTFWALALGFLSKNPWEEAVWVKLLSFLTDQTNQGKKTIAQSLRLALTGQKKGPPMPALMQLIGQEETLNRLKKISLSAQ